MKIGLVGEAPGDIACIKVLLLKKYKNIEFVPLITDFRGNHLDSKIAKRLLRREYEIQKPDFIIFIRDLDGLEDDQILFSQRKEYFSNCNSIVDKKGIFLLNIQEIEALLFTDVGIINAVYKARLPEFPDCMKVADPKRILRDSVKGYIETHNQELFSYYDYCTILNKCRYYNSFDTKFSKTTRLGD